MDLYAAKRAVIICLSDADLELCVAAQEASHPGVTILKKAVLEFQRALPV